MRPGWRDAAYQLALGIPLASQFPNQVDAWQGKRPTRQGLGTRGARVIQRIPAHRSAARRHRRKAVLEKNVVRNPFVLEETFIRKTKYFKASCAKRKFLGEQKFKFLRRNESPARGGGDSRKRISARSAEKILVFEGQMEHQSARNEPREPKAKFKQLK